MGNIMKWRVKKNREQKLNALKQWHSYFAWKPVLVRDGSYVWFGKVWRKLVVVPGKQYFIYSDAITSPEEPLVPDWSKL